MIKQKNPLQINPKTVTPPFRTQKLQLNSFGEREEFNLEIYNPFIERITHVWNKQHQLVKYEKIAENNTKRMKENKQDNKEDFSQKRLKFTVATRVGEPYFMWR